MFQRGDTVRHSRFGIGVVRYDDPLTVAVRFDDGIEECLPAELERIDSVAEVLARPELDAPLDVVAHVLGEAIRSVNDAWGLFSRSRIALLPHQLWVCRQVNRARPARWLVADDVGLGKTIEAGLILLPLIASGEIKRLLILCPAKLVPQWQYRMRTMFDIRLVEYVTEADKAKSDFWTLTPQVVASFHTLRDDHRGRHQRMLEAEPWDMVIVDEAHHLNADEDNGPTLGHQLIKKLDEAGRIRAMVFFTGTPHRGKNFGFLSLLKLLRPDLFDPKKSLESQLPMLREVMIRNNKHEVTDLDGKRLFQEPIVRSETYAYSPNEERFYALLTDFITTGKAYAKSLSQQQSRTAMLVLIAMQKLASSSVAAVRKALHGRLRRTQVGGAHRDAVSDRLREYREQLNDGDDDAANEQEERIGELELSLALMENETPRLLELVEAADAVTRETKILKILELLDGPFAGQPVLFFTEYKATQSLLLRELLGRFGVGCATFINGDDRAEDVPEVGRELNESRESAADRFNAGAVRFLISTEAGGEGIDLQENCHGMIHVDLPWNPMRLQQRVGRLNRYGQPCRVEVLSLRNPATVEARIWDVLNEKIARIQQTLSSVMANPEDVLGLVLGMSGTNELREAFAGANDRPIEDVADWFDGKTKNFGGADALATVRGMVGNVARFDFGQVSAQIPRLDLPDLKPFFKAMLHFNKRKVTDDEPGLAFLTPECWRGSPAARREYDGMVFDRRAKDLNRILGVGHVLVDQSIVQARGLTASVAAVPSDLLPFPLYVFRITDRVTSQEGSIQAVTAAVEVTSDGNVRLRDGDLIERLNRILIERDPRRFRVQAIADPTVAAAEAEAARLWLTGELDVLDLPFQVPDTALIGLLLPGERINSDPGGPEPLDD